MKNDRLRVLRRLVCALSVGLALLACAGCREEAEPTAMAKSQEAYSAGLDALEQKQYDDAIASFTRSI